LKNNEEVVTLAVTRNGSALEFASSNLKGNLGVVLAALRDEPSALKYISQEFIVAAVTRHHSHESNPGRKKRRKRQHDTAFLDDTHVPVLDY